jgi:O-antigen ligase
MDASDTLMFIAGAYILVSSARNAKSWRLLWPDTTGLGWLWLTWIIIVAVGLFYNSPFTTGTLGALLEFRWMLLFHILCFTLSLIEWDSRIVTWLLRIFLVMVGISFIFFFIDIEKDFRAGGPFEHSMPFAHTYGPAFVFSAAFLLVGFYHKTSWRWLALFTTEAAAAICVLSMTRGIWVGMVISIAVISFLYNRRYGAILAASLFTLLALTITFSPDARERVFSKTQSMVRSDDDRKALLFGNLEIVKDYPIFGAGYSQNKGLLKDYYKKLGYSEDHLVSHAHNQYLHFWAGTGTAGLLCFLFFVLTLLRLTLKAFLRLSSQDAILKALALGSFGGQICFLIGSLTESNFSIAKNRYMYLLISAIGISIYYRYIKKINFEYYKKQLLSFRH